MDNKVLKHKGFLGSVECDMSAGILHGKILYINDLVDYNASSIPELQAEFIAAVDDYIDLCHELGEEPQKSASGSFNVRVGPEIHAKILQGAAMAGVSLNQQLKDILSAHFSDESSSGHVEHEYYKQANGSFSGEMSLSARSSARAVLTVVK